MKVTGYLLLALTLLSLQGCATPYQKKGFRGGYSNMKMGKDMFKVTFKGNGYTGSDTVHNYFLRRCAEVTEEQGYDYFALVSQEAGSQAYDMGTNHSGTISQNYSGGYNYSGTSNSWKVNKHTRTGIIKMFKKGRQPASAISAKDFLMNFQQQ